MVDTWISRNTNILSECLILVGPGRGHPPYHLPATTLNAAICQSAAAAAARQAGHRPTSPDLCQPPILHCTKDESLKPWLLLVSILRNNIQTQATHALYPRGVDRKHNHCTAHCIYLPNSSFINLVLNVVLLFPGRHVCNDILWFPPTNACSIILPTRYLLSCY